MSSTSGPVSRFSSYHLWRAIYLALHEGPVSRRRLSEVLGVGEGTGRTVLRVLKEMGHVRITRSGVLATEEASRFLERLGIRIATVNDPEIQAEPCACALIRDCSDMVSYGLEQRDIAVRSGASGAITLIVRDVVTMPAPDGDLIFKDAYPVCHDQITSLLKPMKGDVIVLGLGPTHLGEIGAVTAALELARAVGRLGRDEL